MFNAARAAGLPMLGGVDIFVPSAGGLVRAHYWPASRPLLNPHDEPDSATKLRSECKKPDHHQRSRVAQRYHDQQCQAFHLAS